MNSPYVVRTDADRREYPVLDDKTQKILWGVVIALLLLLTLSYLNGLEIVVSYWSHPQYSHGWIVPLFAAVLVWIRREAFQQVPAWQHWLGVGLITLGVALRLLGASAFFTLDYVSLVPCVMGVFMMVGGLPCIRWVFWPVIFLVFMFPWPSQLEGIIMNRLQFVATGASCYALQTLGVAAYREGNQIHLPNLDHPMNVAEQCSGLRMLTIFMALSLAMALITTDRPLWERVIVVISAIPIALVVNMIRITIVGLLFNLNVKEEVANLIFHDVGGFAMMPIALGFLYLEYQILKRIMIEEDSSVVPSSRFAPGA
ncbi:MAG: exosortase/archaeosortase family protein [Pirellulaceae bacterium]|nr:exosortase/archaeosortase family protein [Planctomycetales bacterium]